MGAYTIQNTDFLPVGSVSGHAKVTMRFSKKVMQGYNTTGVWRDFRPDSLPPRLAPGGGGMVMSGSCWCLEGSPSHARPESGISPLSAGH